MCALRSEPAVISVQSLESKACRYWGYLATAASRVGEIRGNSLRVL